MSQITLKGDLFQGKKFECAEAAFQWAKYSQHLNAGTLTPDHKELMEELYTCAGERAFVISRSLSPYPIPSNWHTTTKSVVMWDILTAKFDQNPDFKSCLMATGATYLLEHNDCVGKDEHWSDNHNGTGKNLLGRMLMAIRDGNPRPQDDPSDLEVWQIRLHAADANKKLLSAKIK